MRVISAETVYAGVWTTYAAGSILLAQTNANMVTGLTIQSAYLVGCMTGGTIGAAIWKDEPGRDPAFGELVGRWLVCACVGLILTPSILWLVDKFTGIPISPNTALVCSGAASFSGYWFIKYLKTNGPGGIIEMAKEIFNIIRGK